MSESKKRVFIRKWSLQHTEGKRGYHLVGEVWGHPKLENGSPAVTSPLLKVDFKSMEAETHNTLYVLEGDPNISPLSAS